MSEENNEFGFGCLPSPIDVRDYKIKRSVSMAYNYPESFSLNHPPVKNQGMVGSCVAHATSEILEYHEKEYKKLSTNFLYGIHYKLYGTQGPGMYPREACKIAKDYGDPEEVYCSGNIEVPTAYSVAEVAFNNPEIRNNAKGYKVRGYAKVKTENDIKYALVNHGPVLISIEWFRDNKINTSNWTLIQGTSSSGYHAIMIYGWNELGWLCQNSWGKLWGNDGCFILPYYYEIYEGYALTKNTDGGDIDQSSKNKFINMIYKVVNGVINFFMNLIRRIKE